VDTSYTRSLKERSGYDIVHRLLLKDGTIKYVREKCRTEYDDGGRPLRSLGTVQDITAQMQARHGFAGIVGREPAMREVFDSIKQLAAVRVPVFIQGESGTGKELVARAIHAQSPRASRPFVPVNCGAIPEGLLESELFGHVRGAFTGASREKKGRFELAHSGTLFLDEVADLPFSLQPKLLRVLAEGRFERLGDERSMKVDVRIISAANRDLKAEVERGGFREDLYYRLRVIPIVLPPLRRRRNDIPLLVDHFLESEAHEGVPNEGVTREALAELVGYGWPGNVRELRSAVQYSLIKSQGRPVRPEHLPNEIRARSGAPGQEDLYQEVRRASGHASAPGRRGRRRKLTREPVERAMEKAGGNKAEAARILGVGRATLYRYLKEHPL
jgi:DNA-binding NtrC family response regulator